MDYKEKFEDFFSKMQGLLENAERQGHIVIRVEDLENAFPELKESEDERIRKALIELVHDTTGDSLWVDYNVHKEDALAWLEKQGEQKPADKDMIEALRTEYEKGRADVIADTLSWLENCWPKYCSNQTIIEGFKEAIKYD